MVDLLSLPRLRRCIAATLFLDAFTQLCVHVVAGKSDAHIPGTYCDSIGCGMPKQVNDVNLELTPFQWASKPELSLSARHVSDCMIANGFEPHIEDTDVDGDGLTRGSFWKWWGGGNDQGERFLNSTLRARFADRLREVVRGPGFWRVAAAPVRRKAFVSSSKSIGEAEFEIEEKQFGADHLVFGSYGSFWIISLLARLMPELAADSCWQILDEWVGAVGAGGGKISDSKEREISDKRLGELSFRAWRTCGRGVDDDRAFGFFSPESWNQQMFGNKDHGNTDNSQRFGKELGYWDRYPKVVRKLCGISGFQGTLGSRLQASVLGSTLYEDGMMETALFISQGGQPEPAARDIVDHDRDPCILVDGQRTFSSTPISYLTPWSCKFKGIEIPAAVVSYSSAVVLISCQLPETAVRVGGEKELFYLEAKHQRWEVPVCMDMVDVVKIKKIGTGVLGHVEDEKKDEEETSNGESAGEEVKVIVENKRDLSEKASDVAFAGGQYGGQRRSLPASRGGGNEEDKSGDTSSLSSSDSSSSEKSITPYYHDTLSACSQVLYNLNSGFARDLLLQWLIYHFELGVDHFYLYDRDGSLKNWLEAMGKDDKTKMFRDKITYFGYFSRSVLRSKQHHAVHSKGDGKPSHAGPDAAAAAHCLFLNRGVSEWVFFVHAPDEFLSNTNGMKNVNQLVKMLRDENADVLDASQVYFVNRTTALSEPKFSPSKDGNKNNEDDKNNTKSKKEKSSSSLIFERYLQRSANPLLQPKGWGSNAPNAFLNRFGSPIVRPEAVSELAAAHYPRPNNLFLHRSGPARILDETPQSIARANHYGHAFSSRDVLDEGDYLVRDESLLWAKGPVRGMVKGRIKGLGTRIEPWVVKEREKWSEEL